MRQRRLTVLILAAVVVVVLAGTLTTHFIASSRCAADQNKAIGAGVTVSGSQVPNAIKAVVVATLQKQAAALVPVSPTDQITPSGALPAPMTLRFKLNSRLGPSDVPLIATSESATGPWAFLQPTISKDRWYASVQTTHLSLFGLVRVDPTAVVNFLKGFLGGLSGGLTTTASPSHCDNDFTRESQAQRDNYTISPSAGATLYWCFGPEGNQRVLKIVNRMRNPIQVSHPGFAFKRAEGGVISDELAQLSCFRSGPGTILFPFEEADYTVNLSPGGTGSFHYGDRRPRRRSAAPGDQAKWRSAAAMLS